MNRTGQGNLYSDLSHGLSSDGTSIVENQASRSLTGRGLGIDVHKHIATQLHLYWRTDSATGCYARCLVRTQLECGEKDLLLDCLVNGGLVGACECLSRCLPVDEDGPLKSCIFCICKKTCISSKINYLSSSDRVLAIAIAQTFGFPI